MMTQSAWKRFLIFLMLLALINGKASAQASSDQMPDLSMPGDYSFINGWEYHIRIAAIGNPFLESKDWETGWVLTGTGRYTGLLLNYDIFQDALLVQAKVDGSPRTFVMNPLFVKEFQLNGRHFVHSHNDAPANDGYLELVSPGKIMLLRRWSKKMIGEKEINRSSFEIKTEIYLRMDGELHLIRNRSSLYALFPEEKKKLQTFLRQASLHPQRTSDAQLKELALFINELVE